MKSSNRTVVVDIETTGLNANNNRIIEIACVEILDGEMSGSVFNYLVNPKGHRITQDAFRVHGIYDHELINEPTFKEIYQELLDFLNDATLVFYNAKFDTDFLHKEFRRLQKVTVAKSALKNTECLMTHITKLTERKRHLPLDKACELWDVSLKGVERHRALGDALLTAELYLAVLKKKKPVKDRNETTKTNIKQIQIPKAALHPITEDKLQYNSCRNINCSNYGVVALNPKRNTSQKGTRKLPNGYSIKGKLDAPSLVCDMCERHYQLINNRSISELIGRQVALSNVKEYACPNDMCSNNKRSIEQFPDRYRLSGNSKVKDTNHQNENWYRETFEDERKANKPKPMEHYHNKGQIPSQRFTCKECGKRFTLKLTPEARHYRKESHSDFFKGLMSGMTDQALCQTLSIQTKTVYDKINFIHQQCLAFEKWLMPNIRASLQGTHLALSTDRQHYSTGWNDRDRIEGFTSLRTIATVDNISGFVLASSLNFDYRNDAFDIRKDSYFIKDHEKPRAFKKYGHYALPINYIRGEQANKHQAFLRQQNDQKRGVLIHETYQMFAHLEQVKLLITPAEYILWSLDNDAGLASSVLSVFQRLANTDKLNIMLLSNKEIDITQQDGEQMDKLLTGLPADLKPHETLSRLWQSGQLPTHDLNKGNRHNEWHLLPKGQMPRITAMSSINLSTMPIAQETKLFEYLGLSGVDKLFWQTRERVKRLSRPITTAKKKNKSYRHAGIDPQWQSKLTDIFRVYFNFCVSGKDGTPAMRIGCIKKAVDVDAILSFSALFEVIRERKKTKWDPYASKVDLPDDGLFRMKKR